MLTEPAPAGLKRLFLQKCKRDAYIMEAGAYEEPTLARPKDFLIFFASFFEELSSLFGKQLFVATATELRDKKTGKWQTFAGYHWDSGKDDGLKDDGHSFPKNIGGRPDQDRALATYLTDPAALFESRLPQGCSSEFANWQQLQSHPLACVVAPYLVRPGLGSSVPHDLNEFVRMPYRNDRGFLHTTPYRLEDGPGLATSFDDAYFAALVLLWAPAPVAEDALHWLEAFHISFQLAWGFPSLIEERQVRASLDEQNRRLKQIQAVAEALAETLQGEVLNTTQRLLALTDPGKLVDSDLLSSLFDVRGATVWDREGLSIAQQHDPSDNVETNRKLIAFLVHRMVGELPNGIKDTESLVASAKTFIQSTTEFTSCEPLRSLFMEALAGEKTHFNFLKDLIHHIVEPKKGPSLYSLAVRLFMSCSADDTQLEITVPGLRTMRSNDFHEVEDRFHLNRLKKLRGLHYSSHRAWIQPFARLVCVELQQHGRKDHARVERITISQPDGATEIRCHVTASERGTVDAVRARFHEECRREEQDRIEQPQKDEGAKVPPNGQRSNGFATASYALWKAVNSLSLRTQVSAQWTDTDLILRIKS